MDGMCEDGARSQQTVRVVDFGIRILLGKHRFHQFQLVEVLGDVGLDA